MLCTWLDLCRTCSFLILLLLPLLLLKDTPRFRFSTLNLKFFFCWIVCENWFWWRVKRRMKTWNLMMIMNFPFCYEVGFNLIKQLYKLDSMFVDGEFNWNFLIWNCYCSCCFYDYWFVIPSWILSVVFVITDLLSGSSEGFLKLNFKSCFYFWWNFVLVLF
jgi:hypothetical protein